MARKIINEVVSNNKITALMNYKGEILNEWFDHDMVCGGNFQYNNTTKSNKVRC